MNQASGGRLRRLASSLRRREPVPGSNASTSPQESWDYNDRKRAQVRYEEAATGLNEAIKNYKDFRGPAWGSFDFEELSSEPESFDDSQFKSKVNAILILRESSIEDRKGWSKFTYAVECVFTVFSPFAKNFLRVAVTDWVLRFPTTPRGQKGTMFSPQDWTLSYCLNLRVSHWPPISDFPASPYSRQGCTIGELSTLLRFDFISDGRGLETLGKQRRASWTKEGDEGNLRTVTIRVDS